MMRFAKEKKIIILFTRAILIVGSNICGSVSRVYLLLFTLLGHDTLVANVGEEKTLVAGDVRGVLVGGGVSEALVGVSLLSHVRLATLLIVIILLLYILLSLVVVVPATITYI
jgi:hypothetical protein